MDQVDQDEKALVFCATHPIHPRRPQAVEELRTRGAAHGPPGRPRHRTIQLAPDQESGLNHLENWALSRSFGKGISKSKMIDFGDKPLPISPKDPGEARFLGTTLARTWLDYKASDRFRSLEIDEVLDQIGAEVGEGIHRDGIPWTLNEFIRRFRNQVQGTS